MSLEAALGLCARETDEVLDRLLPSGDVPAARLAQAMRYAALGGGKRLRPFFVVESAALFGVPKERALRVGAAVECVHCYSLVHDDLPAMDDDDLRRGKPTLHRAFDEATAILAGDSLLTFAFEIVADPATHPDGALRSVLVSLLAKASGIAGMAGGQMLDMGGHPDIESTQRLKTGALFRFACEAGAVLGGADPAPLRRYADNIGLAFQIADDILDVESSVQSLGKATQKDSARGKATFVQLHGLEAARKKAEDLVSAAIAAIQHYGANSRLLQETARFVISRRK